MNVEPNGEFKLGELLERIYELNLSVEEYVEKSTISVGITIVELALAEFCRDLSADASFEDRLIRAQSLLLTQLSKIPRHIRKALCLLLGIENDDNDGKVLVINVSSFKTPSISSKLLILEI